MCIQITASFSECGHTSTYVDHGRCTQDCQNLQKRSEHQDGICFECMGSVERQVVYYKHCFQSTLCNHEYEHMLTTVERSSNEPEVVLVTPIPYDLCPECKASGYDKRPGGTNPPPKIASAMPTDYENLPRMISVLPPDDFLPDDDDSEGMTGYLSSSSQFPSQAPAYQTLAPNIGGDASRALSYRPSTNVPKTFGPSETERAKAPSTAAELLKRGPPKNVARSAFYDNADGEEARAQIGSESTIPSGKIRPSSSAPRYSTSIPSGRPNSQVPSPSTSIPSKRSSSQPVRFLTSIPLSQSNSSAPISSTFIPRNISYTQAPSIDEESLDISDLLKEMKTPSSSSTSRQPTKSVIPSGSRVPGFSLPTVSQIPDSSSSRTSSKAPGKNGRGIVEPKISAIAEEE